MSALKRLFRPREKCAVPEEVKSVFDAFNQQADDVSDLLRAKREKRLLEGALTGASNAKHAQ